MSYQFGKKKNIVSVFFTDFIRIRGVVSWSAVSFVGFILGISILDLSTYIKPLFVFVVSTFCIASFTFSINNYYDIESDRENPRRISVNAFASGKISKQSGLILNLILVIIPLVVSFLYSLSVFFLCFIILIWMWIYSAPPLRLKGRPGIDIIWHFLAFVLLIMWGSYIAGSISLINWLFAISFGVYSCIEQILNHIHDYEFDKKSGTTTFAVWIGLDKTKFSLKLVIVLHLIFLVPLIVLYSFSYPATIIVLILGVVAGLIFMKLKKQSQGYPGYYLLFIFSVAVYLTCILYNMSMLLGEPTLGLINF